MHFHKKKNVNYKSGVYLSNVHIILEANQTSKCHSKTQTKTSSGVNIALFQSMASTGYDNRLVYHEI